MYCHCSACIADHATTGHVPPSIFNDFSIFLPAAQQTATTDSLASPTAEVFAQLVLSQKDEATATGPDLLPARLLTAYAKEVAPAGGGLARPSAREGRWPEGWWLHWFALTIKRKTIFKAGDS